MSRNHLLLIAVEDTGWFFVNDQLVDKLNLSQNQYQGEISVVGDFSLDHRSSPEFQDFNVWAP